MTDRHALWAIFWILTLGSTCHADEMIPVESYEGKTLQQWVNFLRDVDTEGDPSPLDAAKRLAYFGEQVEPLLPELETMACDQNRIAQLVATEALTQCGYALPDYMAVVAQRHSEPKHRTWARTVITGWGSRAADRALPVFERRLAISDAEESLDIIRLLRQLGPLSATTLATQLQREDVAIRAAALGSLTWLGRDAAPATAQIAPLAVDRQHGVAALKLLGTIGREASAALPTLLELLDREDVTLQETSRGRVTEVTEYAPQRVRVLVLQTIARLDYEPAVPHLLEYGQYDAVRLINPHPEKVVQWLEKQLSQPDPPKTLTPFSKLADYAPYAARLQPQLSALIDSRPPDDFVRRDAMLFLQRTGWWDPEHFEQLAQRDTQFIGRYAAFRPEVAPELYRFVDSDDARAARAARAFLRDMHFEAVQILPDLLRDARNSDPVRQQRAAYLLPGLGPAAASHEETIKILAEWKKTEQALARQVGTLGPVASDVRAALDAGRERDRIAALRKLGTAGANTEIATILVQRLTSPATPLETRERHETAYALWRIAQHPLALLILADSSDLRLRPRDFSNTGDMIRHLQMLAEIGEPAWLAVPGVQKIWRSTAGAIENEMHRRLHGPHEYTLVRVAAAEALWRISRRREAVEYLVDILESDEPTLEAVATVSEWAYATAAETLYRCSDSGVEVAPLLMQTILKQRGTLRMTACRLLWEFTKDPRAPEAVRFIIRDPWHPARSQAIQFVGEHLAGSPKASTFVDDVENALNDPRPRVRYEAFSMLVQIAPEKALAIQQKWLEARK